MLDRKFYGWKVELFVLLVVGLGAVVLLINPFSEQTASAERIIEITAIWFQCYGSILVSFEYLRLPLIQELESAVKASTRDATENFRNVILKEKDNEEKLEKIRAHNLIVAQNQHVYRFVMGQPITARVVTGLGLFLIVLGYLIQLSTK